MLFSLLIVLTAVQFGPLATSAHAAEDFLDKPCSPPWAEYVIVTGKSVNIRMRCEPYTFQYPTGEYYTLWRWSFLRFEPADEADQQRRSVWVGDTSPAYRAQLSAMVGSGSGGGAAAGKFYIMGRNGEDLDRTIAVRLIMQVQPGPTSGWLTCHDLGWSQQSASSGKMNFLDQYSQPDCGDGYYRAQVAGRFWSLSLNSWITRGYTYSPAVWVNGPGTITDGEPEPTVTPTPAIESLD
jgi:hypothetical protein